MPNIRTYNSFTESATKLRVLRSRSLKGIVATEKKNTKASNFVNNDQQLKGKEN